MYNTVTYSEERKVDHSLRDVIRISWRMCSFGKAHKLVVEFLYAYS